jgi:hypothetical protein
MDHVDLPAELSTSRLDSGRAVLHLLAMLWRLRSFPDFVEPCLPTPVSVMQKPAEGSHQPGGYQWWL